jgi:Tol biopolymer transport system component
LARLAGGAVLAAVLALPSSAEAAYPGRDGLIAFMRAVGSEPGQIHVVRPNGRGLRQITRRRLGAGSPTWSPDGRRIAFGGMTKDGVHIFVKRLGGRARRITRGTGIFANPTWSPNGRWIAAVRKEFDGVEPHESIVAMRRDGTRRRVIYDAGQRSTMEPAWSPDGKSIAFVHNDVDIKGADPNIYVVPRRGGEARQITGVGLQEGPDWSPDGSLIAYSWGYENLSYDAVHLIRSDGSGEAPVIDAKDPAWAPSGTRLAISRGGQIWTVKPDGSGLRRVTPIEADNVSHYDPTWQPR